MIEHSKETASYFLSMHTANFVLTESCLCQFNIGRSTYSSPPPIKKILPHTPYFVI